MRAISRTFKKIIDKLQHGDFIPLLLIRVYLVPVFWMAGTQKLTHFDSTVSWFGNPEWGLGLPFPWLMAVLAIAAELGGAILLSLGLAVRWISIPLLITMLVAAITTHWHNGWLAIASGEGLFSTDRTEAAIERLARIKSILKEYGNYEWLTEHGSVVILNNGIEFAATYFIMLTTLLFFGGGRWVSLDYWIYRKIYTK